MARAQIWDGSEWQVITLSNVSDGDDTDAIHDNVAGEINAITEKLTGTATDLLLIEDSAASYAKKKVQAGNLPTVTDHGAMTGLGDNDHTQYSLTTHTHGAGTDPIPPGAMVHSGASATPSGYLPCDGAAVNRTTYADLFTAIGTAYGIGDGSTTFNVPDFRGFFPIGKAAAGTASTLGDTGGSLDRTIDIDHTHSQGTHAHTLSHGHADTLAVGDSTTHVHTFGTHTHTTSIDHNHGSATSATATIGATHGSQATSGVFSYNTLNITASLASHTHGDGSYATFGPVSGSSSSASKSHAHPPASNSKEHTHTWDLANYDVASVTSSGTDPGDTNSGGTHNHPYNGAVTDFSGNTADGSGTTGSALSGTESVPNPPFVTFNTYIKT